MMDDLEEILDLEENCRIKDSADFIEEKTGWKCK